MRRMFRVAMLALAVVGCGGSSGADAAGAGQTVQGAAVTIDWHIGAINVQTTVEAGSTVAWRASDGMAHTVTSQASPAAFTELAVAPSGTPAMHRFDIPGTYPHFCSIHGARLMNGTVVVTPTH